MANTKVNPNTTQTVPVNIRISEYLMASVKEAIEKDPAEFRNMSDFYRTAIKNELRRRGILNNYE